MLYPSRRYVVALGVAVIGLAAAIIAPGIADSISAADAKANRARAVAAFAHLNVPPRFRRLPTRDLNCLSGSLCYYVPELPDAITKASLIAVLRSTGAVPDSRSACYAFSHLCAVYARLDGLYISAVTHGYITRAPRTNVRGTVLLISPPSTPPKQ